jgi:uncharacterized protein YndB with AHSA1/START domain
MHRRTAVTQLAALGLLAPGFAAQAKAEDCHTIALVHGVPVNASPERIYAAVATQDGMQGWWTRDTTMNAIVGGEAEFGFDKKRLAFRMTVEELVPLSSVRLRCIGGHPEWEGTTLEWKIQPTAGVAMLRFTHRDWREVTEFAAICNSRWGQLMFRLKDYAETGTRNPQWTL